MQGGEITIGLFTNQDISADTELTFDYNFERYGDKVVVCLHALLKHAATYEVCMLCIVMQMKNVMLSVRTHLLQERDCNLQAPALAWSALKALTGCFRIMTCPACTQLITRL